MGIKIHKFERVFETPDTSRELCNTFMRGAQEHFLGATEIVTTTLVFAKDKQFDQNLDCRELAKSNEQIHQLANSIKSVCSEVDARGFVLVCRMWLIRIDKTAIVWSFTREIPPNVKAVEEPAEMLVSIAQIKGQAPAMRAARVKRANSGTIRRFLEPGPTGRGEVYWPVEGVLAEIL